MPETHANIVAYGNVSQQRLEEISRYSSRSVTLENFRDPSKRQDLQDILLYHPNPIVRHEASFAIGELELWDMVPLLMKVVKHDKSIVCKHEAVEVMGHAKGAHAKTCYEFLQRLNTAKDNDPEIYHPDVQATITESLSELEKEISKFSERS